MAAEADVVRKAAAEAVVARKTVSGSEASVCMEGYHCRFMGWASEAVRVELRHPIVLRVLRECDVSLLLVFFLCSRAFVNPCRR